MVYSRFISSFFLISFSIITIESAKLRSEPPNIEPQIINGSPAWHGQFPFQVAVFLLNSTLDRIGFCGGSLIAVDYVLTSAHCAATAFGFEMYFGGVNLLDMEISSISADFVIHPQYDPNTLHNDVALIALSDALIPDAIIQPIAISPNLISVCTTAYVAGFGKTYDTQTSISSTLLFAQMTVISDAQCQTAYGNLINTQMCAIGYCQGYCAYPKINKKCPCAYQNICNGDAGGALVVQDANGVFSQIGIVSFGSATSCQKGYPSVYAEMYFYHGWVQNNMNCWSLLGYWCLS